jgi:MFS family permease
MNTPDAYASLRLPDFRNFITAKVFITMAIQIQAVAVGWHVYALTHDPLSLGMIGLAEAIPAIGVSLFAGHLADTISRKSIVFWCYMTLLVGGTSLALISSGWVAIPLHLVIFALFFTVFLTGLARGFLSPAHFGLMSQCVPKDLYPNSSIWNSSLWEIAVVLGAGAGGLLYANFGPFTTYLLVGLLCVTAMGFLFLIPPKPLPQAQQTMPILDSLLGGLKFVFNKQVFLAAMSLDLFAVFFGGAVSILPIFADDILQCGPQGLGWLRAAPSIGSFLMALYLAYHPPLRNTGRLLFASVAGFGLCMIFFALSTHFWLSFAFLIVSGVFDNVSVVVRSTIMQMLTPDDMKGRVSAVHSIFVGSSNEIGAFESGVAAKYLGTVPSVVFGGIATLCVVLAGYVVSPKLRTLHLKQEDPIEQF